MNWVSIIITVALAGMLAALAIWLPLAILRNLDRGHERRRKLAAGVDSLRLSSMLSGMGIDQNNYLHTERVVDIERHMQQCGDCQAIDQCDEKLVGDTAVNAADVQFCPNADDLGRANP